MAEADSCQALVFKRFFRKRQAYPPIYPPLLVMSKGAAGCTVILDCNFWHFLVCAVVHVTSNRSVRKIHNLVKVALINSPKTPASLPMSANDGGFNSSTQQLHGIVELVFRSAA